MWQRRLPLNSRWAHIFPEIVTCLTFNIWQVFYVLLWIRHWFIIIIMFFFTVNIYILHRAILWNWGFQRESCDKIIWRLQRIWSQSSRLSRAFSLWGWVCKLPCNKYLHSFSVRETCCYVIAALISLIAFPSHKKYQFIVRRSLNR